ncbi:enoyl-CoA hydratase-related protein [Variovorax sp. J31P179]|uniref:enoyl-CoA hydratase-related protein n=1 Tax=Variovorax sp. J31P179 TaxID=3053508 RepID=UPI0025761479|nr:enoyl-CoA hydratase-related protein [Variovorax sp. J31P179]MDM0085364.1 enoyl-CoA hydratase-related protein [Variovorax sp. J31P179]
MNMHRYIQLDTVQCDTGTVARVTICNAAEHNSLPAEGRAELADLFGEVSRLANLRCVVLTGDGNKAFIGGSNINQMAAFKTPAEAQAASYNTHLACEAIRRCPVPVIARIDGYCLGAGMIIAASCDLRIASVKSKFGMPEVKYGIPSAMETCLLPRLVGWGKTMEMIYTANFMDHEDAHRLGFVQRVVPVESLDECVDQWVQSILAVAPNAVRLQKKLVHDWERMSLSDSVQAGVLAIGAAHESGEPKERIRAYLEEKKQRVRLPVALG